MDKIGWLQVGYVTFGVLLGWLLSVSKDFINSIRERKEILTRFHQEIQFYRINFNQPGISEKSNSINLWPEISSSFVRLIAKGNIISVKKNKELFSKCIDLIRDIEFYHRVMDCSYTAFATRFSSSKDVYSALLPPLILVRKSIRDLDLILSKITKTPFLEIQLDDLVINNIDNLNNNGNQEHSG